MSFRYHSLLVFFECLKSLKLLKLLKIFLQSRKLPLPSGLEEKNLIIFVISSKEKPLYVSSEGMSHDKDQFK